MPAPQAKNKGRSAPSTPKASAATVVTQPRKKPTRKAPAKSPLTTPVQATVQAPVKTAPSRRKKPVTQVAVAAPVEVQLPVAKRRTPVRSAVRQVAGHVDAFNEPVVPNTQRVLIKTVRAEFTERQLRALELSMSTFIDGCRRKKDLNRMRSVGAESTLACVQQALACFEK